MAPSASSGRDGTLRGRRRRQGSSVPRARQPEGVRVVYAEMGARIPVPETVFRHVLQTIGDDDRLQDAADDADGEELIGMDLEHPSPDLLLLGQGAGVAPRAIEINQFPGGRNVPRTARGTAGLEVLT